MILYQFRLESAQSRRSPMTAPNRPTSASGFRGLRSSSNSARGGLLNSNLNPNTGKVESTLLDENGLPLVGHLLAFTPDVVQVFQDAAKLIEESREIKKQTMNQIRDAFNDAKAYSLTVNQSVAQKLADIITLAVRNILMHILFITVKILIFLATFNYITG